jgi:hypothetical protein
MPWTFEGRLDLLAGSVIVDNKTSGKPPWGAPTIAEQMQPAAYDLLTRYSPESPIRGRDGVDTDFQFHVSHHTVNGKWRKAPVAGVYPVVVTQAARDGFLNIVAAAHERKTRVLQSGAAMPNYGWQCKGCGFRDACAFEFGREPPA